jgi:RNA polymerase sigma factor (sigma-70 family)
MIPACEQTKRPESERSLVQRAQNGDEQAFATLFQTHKKRVYSVCLLMTKDIAEAEDLTQEAFLQVFRSVGSFRGDSAFSTWQDSAPRISRRARVRRVAFSAA